MVHCSNWLLGLYIINVTALSLSASPLFLSLPNPLHPATVYHQLFMSSLSSHYSVQMSLIRSKTVMLRSSPPTVSANLPRPFLTTHHALVNTTLASFIAFGQHYIGFIDSVGHVKHDLTRTPAILVKLYLVLHLSSCGFMFMDGVCCICNI
ncbi:hypothetical protein DM860_008161 [Cuscuta australis]|uniref:Uncharacterized protein n=1 Tax=Cuscuta australis TaxID=267555 RepID=A0A328D6S9_9ASTE|nr:hypothetical protein DM860_008161 [Cuscuta australis]